MSPWPQLHAGVFFFVVGDLSVAPLLLMSGSRPWNLMISLLLFSNERKTLRKESSRHDLARYGGLFSRGDVIRTLGHERHAFSGPLHDQKSCHRRIHGLGSRKQRLGYVQWASSRRTYRSPSGRDQKPARKKPLFRVGGELTKNAMD